MAPLLTFRHPAVGLLTLVALAASAVTLVPSSVSAQGDERLGPEADSPHAGPATVVPSNLRAAGPVPAPASLPDATFVTAVDNGAWSWFQDQRLSVDECSVLVGSVASRSGVDGLRRSGDIQVSEIDRRTGDSVTHILERDLFSDDHNAPASLALDDGHAVTAFAGHNEDSQVRFARRPLDGMAWEAVEPVTRSARTSYANLHLIEEDDRLINITRAERSDPVVIESVDRGRTWQALGSIFDTPSNQWPYTKYAAEGDDLHILVTPSHPNQAAESLSIYHGILRGDGVITGSDGSPVGLLGEPLRPADLTLIPDLGGEEARAWPIDLEIVDGTPVALYSVHQPTGDGAHRADYALGRWEEGAWSSEVLADAGSALYPGQPFYTGGGALHPHDPDQVYVSTSRHPVSGIPLVSDGDGQEHHEIFHGQRGAGGSWSWSAVTAHSVVDNLRPIFAGDPALGHALLWFRGSYSTYVSYDTEVVGFVEPTDAECGPQGIQLDRVLMPVAGDFDGDGHRDDLLFYGPGAAPDMYVLTDDQGRRRSEATRMGGDHTVLVGDFDGDGTDDVFWYTPGPAADRIWYHRPEGTLSVPVMVNGRYEPVVGDFDGDGIDDIFWYAPGPAADSLWSGRPDRTFVAAKRVVNGVGYRPVAGDFDGDGVGDIFWYGPGSIADSIWYGRRGGGIRSVRTTVNGDYWPLAGDLDGDGVDDILWFGPGAAPDRLWYLRAGSITDGAVPALSVGAPVLGDFDGDGVTDILLVVPGPGRERLWLGSADRVLQESG